MRTILLFALLFLSGICLKAQENINPVWKGMFSVGTRNTLSFFNDDAGMGKGIGGHFRLQFSRKLNSEWFFDYISSTNGSYTYRNDYHIGWSLLWYTGKNPDFKRLFQPYILAGHCFDYTRVTQQDYKLNSASRFSLATQAGMGTHLNISPRFDCSLSGQYMLHFGKEINTVVENNSVTIQKQNFSRPHGHMLATISFNYKLFNLFHSGVRS